MAGNELDFTSPDFDALKALYAKDLQPPVPNVHVFNNINEYAVSLKTGKPVAKKVIQQESDLGQRLKNIANNKSRNRNRDPSRLAHLMKVKSKTDGIEEKVAMLEKTKKRPRQKNVLEKMEDSYKEGPLSILYNCIEKKKQLKVWTRRLRGLRGVCVGYLVAFDKHMNLAMMDVDEMFAIEEEIEYDPMEEQQVIKKKEKKKMWRQNKRKQLKLDKMNKENQNTVELQVCDSDLADRKKEETICDKDQEFGFSLNTSNLGSICDELNTDMSKTEQHINNNKQSNLVKLGKLFYESNIGSKETSCLSDMPLTCENASIVTSTISRICSNDAEETKNMGDCDIDNLCGKLTHKESGASDTEETSSDIEGKDGSNEYSSDDGKLQICDIQSENENDLGVVNILLPENIEQEQIHSKAGSLLNEDQLQTREDVDFKFENNNEIHDILTKEIDKEEWIDTCIGENPLQDSLLCENNVTIPDIGNGEEEIDCNVIKVDNIYERTLETDIERYDIEMITEEIIRLEEEQVVNIFEEKGNLMKIEHFGGTSDDKVDFEIKQSCISICEKQKLIDTEGKTNKVGSNIVQEETLGKFKSCFGSKMEDEINVQVEIKDKILQHLKETEIETMNVLGRNVCNVQHSGICKGEMVFIKEQTLSTFSEEVKTICKEKECNVVTTVDNFENKKQRGTILATGEGVSTSTGDVKEDIINEEKVDKFLKAEEIVKQGLSCTEAKPVNTFVADKEYMYINEEEVEFRQTVDNIHEKPKVFSTEYKTLKEHKVQFSQPDEKFKETGQLSSTEDELVSCFTAPERHKEGTLSSTEDEIIASSVDQKTRNISEKRGTECFLTVGNIEHKEEGKLTSTEDEVITLRIEQENRIKFNKERKTGLVKTMTAEHIKEVKLPFRVEVSDKGTKHKVKEVKCLESKEGKLLSTEEESIMSFVKDVKQGINNKEKEVELSSTEGETVGNFVEEATQGTNGNEKKVECLEDRGERELLSTEDVTVECFVKEVTQGTNKKEVEYHEDKEDGELLSSEEENVTIVENDQNKTEWLGGGGIAEKEEGELSSTDDETSDSLSHRKNETCSKNYTLKVRKQKTKKGLSKCLKKLDKDSMKEKDKLIMRKKRFSGLVKGSERTSGKERERLESDPKDRARNAIKSVSKSVEAERRKVEKRERDKCDREKEVKNKTKKEPQMKEKETRIKARSIDKLTRNQTSCEFKSRKESDLAKRSSVSSDPTLKISNMATSKQRTKNSVSSSVKDTCDLKKKEGLIRNVKNVAGMESRRASGGQPLTDKVWKNEQKKDEREANKGWKPDKEKETRKEVNKDNTMVKKRGGREYNLEEENKARRDELDGKRKEKGNDKSKNEHKIKQLVATKRTPKIIDKCETTKRPKNDSTCLNENNDIKGRVKESGVESKREKKAERRKGNLSSNDTKSSPSIIKQDSSLKLKISSKEKDLLKKTSTTKKVKTKSIVSKLTNVQEKEKRTQKSTSLNKEKCGKTESMVNIDLYIKDKDIENKSGKDPPSQNERSEMDNKGSGQLRNKSVKDCQSFEESKKNIRLRKSGTKERDESVKDGGTPNNKKRTTVCKTKEEKKENVKRINKEEIEEDKGSKKTDTKTRLGECGNERKRVDRDRKFEQKKEDKRGEKKQTEMVVGNKNKVTTKTKLKTKLSQKTKVSGKRLRDTGQISRPSKIRKISSEKRTLKTKEAKLPGNVVTVRILKTNRGKALVLKQRHVNQLFLRGDNIIMVAYQNDDCIKNK